MNDFLTLYRALMDEARRLARLHQTSGVTLEDGIEVFRLSGATDTEVDEYVLERSRVVLAVVAACHGITIVGRRVEDDGEETVH